MISLLLLWNALHICLLDIHLTTLHTTKKTLQLNLSQWNFRIRRSLCILLVLELILKFWSPKQQCKSNGYLSYALILLLVGTPETFPANKKLLFIQVRRPVKRLQDRNKLVDVFLCILNYKISTRSQNSIYLYGYIYHLTSEK